MEGVREEKIKCHHAGLCEHMLASSQGGKGEGPVQVRPCADDDGINVGVLYQLPPVASGLHAHCVA